MPKAKYTLEGLEALRKERVLTHSEYQCYWRLKNPEKSKAIEKKASTKRYAEHKEEVVASNNNWINKNREKYNETKRLYQTKKRAEAKVKRETYYATPEGIAKIEARKKASKEKRKVYVAQWRTDNPEKVKETADRTRLKNRDKRLAQTAAWRTANPEHVKEYQTAYTKRTSKEKNEKQRENYAADPERAKAYKKAWLKADPKRAAQIARTSKARRRAAKAAAGGSHTQAEIESLFTMQNARCANPYCCVEITMKDGHLDHIYPLLPRPGGKQGSNSIANLAWLCQPCNQRKTNLDPAEWAKREARRAGLF